MVRERGTFNFSASLEIKKEGALDARQIVNTKAELTLTSTWLDDDNKVWLYKGLLVCVVADTDINNGVYFLIDKDNYTISTNWVKIGSISGNTPDELVEAINNALKEAKAYTDDKAGTVTFTKSNYINNSGDLTEAVIELDDLIKNIKDTYLPLSGGTMTGPIGITYNGIQTPSGNKLIFYNDSELWFGHKNYRGVWETSNTDLLHRKNDTNYTILDTSNFVAGTDYLTPGAVTIADISDLGSTWDSYLKAGVYDRNITVNGTSYPVMTDVSGATAINIYAPTAAGSQYQVLRSSGSGAPVWSNINDVINASWIDLATYKYDSTNGTRFVWNKIGQLIGGSSTRQVQIRLRALEDNNYPSYSEWIMEWGVYNPSTAATPASRNLYLAPTTYNSNHLDISIDEDFNIWIRSDVEWDCNLQFRIEYNNSNANIGQIIFASDIETIDPATQTKPTFIYEARDICKARSTGDEALVDYMDNGYQYLPKTRILGTLLVTEELGVSGDYMRIGDSTLIRIPNSSDASSGLASDSTGGTYFWFPADNNLTVGNSNCSNLTIRTNSGTNLFHQVGTGTRYKIFDTGNLGTITFTGAVSATYNGQSNITVNIPQGGGTADSVDWANVQNKPSTFTPSAHTHTASQVTGLANVATSGSYNDLTDTPAATTLSSLGVTATATELNYVDGVTGNIQAQLNGKAATTHTHTASQVTDLAPVATSGSYNDLSDKPLIPSAYTLPIATSDTLGGIRVGGGLTISGAGVLSATGGGVADSVDIENVEGLNSSWLALLQTAPTRYVTADPTWEQVSSKPVFASVATSGSYDDLTDKPTIPSLSGYATQSWVNSQGFLTSVAWDDIQSKPSSFTPSTHTHPVSQVTGIGTITFTGAVSATYNGTQNISVNIPTAGGGVADSVDWSNITNKPSWIGSSKPTYSFSEISGTIAIGDLPTGTTSSTVALGNHTHSNYLTSSSLSGYATQSWVQDQGYLTSVPAQSWSSITGKPSWIGSSKPSYSYSEISGTIPVADLPIATADTVGAVRVGAGLTINSSGVLSATGGGTADAVDLDNITGMNSTWKTLLASAPTRYVTSDPTWSQITGKPSTFTPASHTHVFSDITFNNTGTNSQYLAGDGKFYTISWNEISGKPSTFSPSSHTHSASDITSGTLSISRIPTGTTSSTVALGNHGHHFDDITFNNTGTNKQYLAGNGNFYTIAYSELSGTPDLSDYASSSHTHGTDDIVYLTGYTEGTSTTTLNASMTLNLALASLQNQILTKQAAGNYATESYVDDAVANVSIDTSGFVTLTGTQTISGAKTFTNSNGVRSTYGFYDTSDIRLKSNIQDIELKDKINLYEFDKQGKHSYGVIAQEVEQLYPSVVNTDENGYKTVNYNEVLSIKCAELEAENKELKARLDKLEALVNSLL